MALSKAAEVARRRDIPMSRLWPSLRDGHLALIVLCVAVIMICARVAGPFGSRAITSDESLYLSEAVSIAHGRLTYSSGEPIVHRPPLYPATIAPVMRLTGNSVSHARIVPLLYAIGALAALFALARGLFGTNVALITALIAAAAEAPGRLAGSFNVDTPAAMWLLASAAILVGPGPDASNTRSSLNATRAFAAGALLGLAFLTKETAALWLPLPVVVALLASRRTIGWRAILGFYVAFAAVAAPWLLWSGSHTHSLFKLEARLTLPAMVLTLAAAALLLTIVLLVRLRPTRGVRSLGAALLMATTAAAALYALESRPEPHTVDYFRSVPDWTAHVFATNVEPFPLIAAAWAYGVWSFVGKRDERLIVPLAFGALGIPLYAFVANRGWEVRQVLPLVYISYALLAWLITVGIEAITGSWTQTQRAALLAGAVMAVMATAGVASSLGASRGVPRNDATTDWRNPAEAEIASWLAELPAGTTVLSSRLYSTQLYVETDAKIGIRQLPTLAITMKEASREPRVASTLFRYQDAGLDSEAKRTWVYARRYGDAPYYIGLAAEDLEVALNEPTTDYVLITGDDAGFSSYSYITNFEKSGALTSVRTYDDGIIRSELFQLNASRGIDVASWPLAIRWEDAQQILRDVGERGRTDEFWKALAPNGVLLSGQRVESGDMPELLAE